MSDTDNGKSMIELAGVSKWFGDFQALKDVDLDVGRQEVVVVCGPSGSGKSTMIRCINRLEKHDGGRIVVDGIELSDDIRNIQEVRREVGMVFQQFNLFPHLTVLENITLAPRQVRRRPRRKQRRGRWRSWRVRIPEQAHKYPPSFQAASSSAPRSRARSRWSRRSCSSTSRPRPSIRR